MCLCCGEKCVSCSCMCVRMNYCRWLWKFRQYFLSGCASESWYGYCLGVIWLFCIFCMFSLFCRLAGRCDWMEVGLICYCAI